MIFWNLLSSGYHLCNKTRLSFLISYWGSVSHFFVIIISVLLIFLFLFQQFIETHVSFIFRFLFIFDGLHLLCYEFLNLLYITTCVIKLIFHSWWLILQAPITYSFSYICFSFFIHFIYSFSRLQKVMSLSWCMIFVLNLLKLIFHSWSFIPYRTSFHIYLCFNDFIYNFNRLQETIDCNSASICVIRYQLPFIIDANRWDMLVLYS